MNQYITSLKIKNYRSCRKTNVDLSENLTVLIGKNGSGKTNILNALLLLKNVSKSNLHRRRLSTESFLNKTEIEFNFHQKEEVYALKFNILSDVREENSDRVVDAEVSVKKSSNHKWGKKISVGNINSYMQAVNRYSRYNAVSEDNFKSDFKRAYHLDEEETESIEIAYSAINFFDGMSYFSATQFADPSKCPVVLEIEERGLRTHFGSGSYHQQFLYDLYKSSVEDSDFFKSYLELLSSEELGLMNSIEFKSQTIESNSYEVRTGGDFRKTKKDKIIIIPYVSIDGLNLSFNQLSEGTFKTLAIVFYILRNEDNLMLVEEPEVCIHHGLLGFIMELVQQKSKESQLIVSTHSDYMLDKLRPEDIILVEKDGEKGTSAKLLTKKLSANDYKALKSYLSQIGNLGDYWKETGF